MTRVPNEFPTVNASYRLAIIGDAPGTHEVATGRPFMGGAGQLLNGALQSAKVMRSAVFTGNVCQVQPPGGDIEELDKAGLEIQEGLRILASDLNKFQPHCCLLLGGTPLWAAGITHKVTSFRGTIFAPKNQAVFKNFKCVSTFHPAAVQRVWDWAPLLNFDVHRAVEEAHFSELKLPERRLRANCTAAECIRFLEAIPDGTLVSVDIEGGIPNPEESVAAYRHLDGVTCVAVSTSPDSAFIIPINDFDDQTKAVVMSAFARVMSNPRIPKVLQNSLYDFVVLAWHWKIHVANIAHDTMLSGWEHFPELPKSLGVQASIWTKEPYYKFERKIEDKQTHYEYCCKDAAVTLEIHQAHMAALSPTARQHYEFNMQLIPSLQFMSLRGMRYDRAASDDAKGQVQASMEELQAACNLQAGKDINLNSPKQLVELLYRHFRLPPKYSMKDGRKTNSLTTDADALLHLYIETQHPFLSTLLAWKKQEGRRKQLCYTSDHDERMRCSYNLVGAETGRLSCSGSNTGSGTNLQTIMKINRQFFLADPGYHFFQCDLEGADGWTVAAHCASLGDPTMMEDYLFGMKPAKIIALMHLCGEQVNRLSRPELKALMKSTDIPDSIYAICKVIQHGSNYGMGINMMSNNVLTRSFKESHELNLLYLSPKDCKPFQNLYFKRYPGVQYWHRDIEQKLKATSTLPCASGHTRTFFGRPGDKETLKQALAHEPQANTTYVTNLAMHRLWHDPDNRYSDGSLIIQPLHSVHDALCGQFPIVNTEWAVEKIRSYFNNPIRIGNTTLTIPYEGGYGPSWYHTSEKTRLGAI